MKIAIGSDERTHLTDFVVHYLQAQEHEMLLFGSLAENDPDGDWPLVSSHVAAAVAGGQADQGWYLKNFYDEQPALNFGWARPDPTEPWQDAIDSPGPRDCSVLPTAATTFTPFTESFS